TFRDRLVVIGNGGSGVAAYAAIPGHRRVPASIVAILAGETLLAGPGTDIGWAATFLIVAALLAIVLIVTHNPRARHWGYALVGLSIPAWFLFSAYARMTPHLAVPAAFLTIYGIARAWHSRKRGALLIDELSGLPNFRALENALARQNPMTRAGVVVAR